MATERKRITVEGFFHKPKADIFQALDFLREKGGTLGIEEETHAHLYYKGFLSEEDTQKLLTWHESIEDKADSGKLVVLVDYEPPYVVEWHTHPEQDGWHHSLEAGLKEDNEGLRIFVSRLEHLLHMG